MWHVASHVNKTIILYIAAAKEALKEVLLSCDFDRDFDARSNTEGSNLRVANVTEQKVGKSRRGMKSSSTSYLVKSSRTNSKDDSIDDI